LKKKAKQGQTLSYPLVLRGEDGEKIVNTLFWLKEVTNKYLGKYYKPAVLEMLSGSEKKAYKVLEPLVTSKWKKRIPSRINRGVLEITGRVLRTINARRNLFELLSTSYGDNPCQWDYRKLIEYQGIYVKAMYVQNLAEQTENFLKRKEKPAKDLFGFLQNKEKSGKDFFEIQARPRLKQAILSFAPDDGQAIQMERHEDYLVLRLKVLEDDKWKWVSLAVTLPPFLRSYMAVAPDIRVVCVHGEWVPVLDYKIQRPCEEEKETPYFLTVDWGVRKLITVCVFDRQEHQICPPIFLKFETIHNKLSRIRTEIDALKAKRDSWPRNSSLWAKYNREIARRWRKFRAIQKELAHLASSVIVLIAQIYGCSEIYVEWLKGLKSQKYGHSLNWLINTTVREAIYEKVAYKAKLVGIELKRPVQPYGTSQYCPRCGKKGIHTQAPNQTAEVKSGGWFLCPSCGYNADRDYVACCNLARKVLYGNLKDNLNVIAYKAIKISDLLFRQSSCFRKRLRQHLNGWKAVISLQPQKFSCGTLRS